jgi:hypothetical protein
MKVFIYRNLNRTGHIYSIKSLEGISKGKVIGYAPRIVVDNAQLVVSQAGRDRVLRQKRKNVHAGVVGDLVMVSGWVTRMHNSKAEFKYCNEETFIKDFPVGVPIQYNPYKYKTFVTRAGEQPIHQADRVTFCNGNVGIYLQIPF